MIKSIMPFVPLPCNQEY